MKRERRDLPLVHSILCEQELDRDVDAIASNILGFS